MKNQWFLRGLAAVLCLQLVLPNSALALRPQPDRGELEENPPQGPRFNRRTLLKAAPAVNEALKGREVGLLLGVWTFEDENGRILHALFV